MYKEFLARWMSAKAFLIDEFNLFDVNQKCDQCSFALLKVCPKYIQIWSLDVNIFFSKLYLYLGINFFKHCIQVVIYSTYMLLQQVGSHCW